MMSKSWFRFLFISLLVVIISLSLMGSAFAGGNSDQGKVPLEKARQVLEERLIGLPGIAGIAHSERTGEIIVFLENEKAKGQAPDRFDGFPVRMEITGEFQARTVGVTEPVAPSVANEISGERRSTVRPLIGGVSVSAYVENEYWAGTLGMVTYDNKILTNTHVIALDLANNYLPEGTPVVQPGSLDSYYGGIPIDDTVVGTLEKYIPISFEGRSSPNYADAAIATINADYEDDTLPGWQFGTDSEYSNSKDYQISGTATVEQGDPVRKSGRTTGVTESDVYLTNASVTVGYGSGYKAYFKDQIIIYQYFSDSGDSGSAVMDEDGKFVGLVFAGSTYYSIVCKASYIIEGLGIAVEPTTEKILESIVIEPATASIAVGSTLQFTATGIYSDDSSEDLTAEVIWDSSNDTVATINESGIAAGMSEGLVNITATLNTLSGTATLTVTDASSQPEIVVSVDVTTDFRPAGKNKFVWAIATVNVTLEGDTPVAGAVVEGHWDAPASLAVSGITDASGDVSFQYPSVKNPASVTTFTFSVDRVIIGGITYLVNTSGSATWTLP